jgi:large repetitive protein
VEPYNFSVSSGTLPLGLALDPTSGSLSGTPTVAGTFSFTITATDTNLCTGDRDYQFVVGCSAIAVAPVLPGLPDGTAGTPYAATFTASGGADPYTFSLGAGSLPAGLTLDPATGELTGTPTVSDRFNFQVVATDASGCSGAQEYVLIIDCAAITLSPNRSRLAGGTVGTPYNAAISATGGAAPFTFAVVAGSLPAGLTLDAATGTISGTPTTASPSLFTIRATDAAGCSGERQYRITVN